MSGGDGRRLIAGVHPVREALRAGQSLDELLLARGEDRGEVADILERAESAGVAIRRLSRRELDELTPDVGHQGVAARGPAYPYRRLREVLDGLAGAPAPPLLVALDHVTDPHNLGAVARAAETAGVDALLLPTRRAAPVTTVAEAAAAGALAHLPVIRESNLATALRSCRDAGLWIVGLAGDGPVGLHDCELLEEPVVVVAGSEGAGLARLTRQRCDQLVSLPVYGQLTSLNVAMAAAVALHEARRRRVAAAG